MEVSYLTLMYELGEVVKCERILVNVADVYKSERTHGSIMSA